MVRLLFFLILLIASVWFGLVVLNHPGFLLIVYQPWMVQMPLWFALLSFLLIFAVFYLLFNSIERLQFFWFKIKNWMRLRREHKAYSKTQHGLSLLIEGQWAKAERLLLSGVSDSVDPLINYLGAAKAAQKQGAIDRRDSYLQKAYQINPDAELAIGITKAELQIEQNQLEQASATLDHLRQAYPRQPAVLKLLEKTYVHLGEWKNLQSLLPALRKASVLNNEQLNLFEKNVYCELLRESKFQSVEEVHAFWKSLPRSVRKNPDVAFEYVMQLQKWHETKEMDDIIRKTLKTSWQPELIRIYSTLPNNNINSQLVLGAAWLKIHGPKPELYLLLGKLCVKAQLWGKAKDYFEKCLQMGPNPEASLEYGKLLEHLDEREEAIEKYREGLADIQNELQVTHGYLTHT